MKKRYILLFVTVQLFLTTHIVNAQVENLCGFDSVLSIQQQTDPDFNNRILGVNDAINHYINSNNNILSISPGAQYIIPVVVHIVRDPSDQVPVISYSQVQSQIEALNAAFAAGYSSYNGQLHGPYAADTKIQFCLAGKAMGPPNWTNTNEPGVMRYSDAARANAFISIASTNDLLENLTHPGLISTGTSVYFPFDNYLNIWVVRSIEGLCSGIQAYSLIGSQGGQNGFAIDGVVIRGDIFGDNSVPPNNFTLQPHSLYGTGCFSAFAQHNQGKILAHEVGHYLALFHTFQNDIFTTATCAGSTLSSCNNEGDFCCDTPPCNKGSLPTYNCIGTRQTCNETYAPYQANYNVSTVNPNDQTENYMYYSNDACWNTFTKDQSDRMVAYLNLFRSTLVSLQNMAATEVIGQTACIPAGLFPQFTYSGNACINLPLNFEPIVPAPSNTAINYNWSFPGGSPTSSNLQNPTITYGSTGNYTATLTVDDGVNPPVSYSLIVAVSACQLNPVYINNANWYYGQYAAADFTSGIPIPTNAALVNQTVFTNEGSYSYSDNNGNLVFYTNAINIWNDQHQQINTAPVFTTAAAIYNNVTASTESINSVHGIIGVPLPDNPDKYILFCAPAQEDISTNVSVRYTILDLNTNTVAPVQNLVTGEPMSEGLTIMPHCNGKDFWLITRSKQYDNAFYVFLISSLGLHLNPIVSGGFDYWTSYGVEIKGSPDNQKIVIAGGSAFNPVNKDIAKYNFDNSNGIVTNEVIFDAPGYSNFYGCSFSPNSNQIYAVSLNPSGILQFDLTGNSTVVATNTFNVYLQLGPDDNLYAGVAGYPAFTGRITNPDSPNNVGAYNSNAIDYTIYNNQVKIFFGSIPNLIDGIQPSFTSPTIIASNSSCTEYEFSIACWGGYTHTWNFGDGSPLIVGNPVSHNYTSPGSYTVTCVLTIPGGTGNITVQYNVFIPGPSVAITGPVAICENNTTSYIYSVPFVQGATYNWSVSANGTIIGPATGSQIDVQFTSGTSGTISVTIVNNNCTTSGTLNVTINPPPVISINVVPVVACSGETITLTATGGQSYFWSYNNQSFAGNPLTDNPIVTTTYTVTGTDINGCQASATVTVVVNFCCTPSNFLIPPTIISLNNTSSSAATIPPNSFVDIAGTFTVNTNLTLTTCTLRMAPGAIIDVLAGNTLSLNGCRIYACTDMWDRIHINPGANLISTLGISGPPFTIINTIIEDGLTAVYSDNGGSYDIQRTTFNKNHIGIFCSSMLMGTHPGIVRRTVFDCTAFGSSTPGSTLKAPFAGQKGRFGIEVFAVNSITIGISGSPVLANNFQNIDIGIHARAATVNAYRNNFNNITAPMCFQMVGGPPCAEKGWGIWVQRSKLNVGDPSGTGMTNNFTNTFSNSHGGILAEFASVPNIHKNTFTNITTPPLLKLPRSICIYVRNNSVNLLPAMVADNTFTNFRIGIYFENNLFANTQILHNDLKAFNYSNGTAIYFRQNQSHPITIKRNRINQTANQLGQYGIRVQNAVQQSFFLNIEENTIRNMKHHGIWVTNYNRAFVSNHNSSINTFPGSNPGGIFYPANHSSANYSVGIKMENTPRSSVVSNTIEKAGANPVAAFTTKLYGISMETNNSESSLRENIARRLGTGLNFYGQPNSPLFTSCNNMVNNRVGLALDNTFIGNQGAAPGPNLPNGIAQDNQWTIPTGFTGATKVPVFAASPDFYTRSNALPFMPNTGTQMNPTFSVLPQLVPVANYTCSFGCANPPCPQIGGMKKMVKKENPFDNLTLEEVFMVDLKVYEMLKQDSAYTTTGNTQDDSLFIAFRDSLSFTNIGRIYEFTEKLAAGDTLGAENAMLAIAPALTPETNHKTVMEIYFNTWAKGIFEFTSQDSLTLYNVAIQRPHEGGTAVYDARVMLEMDEYDFAQPERSAAQPEDEGSNTPVMTTISENFRFNIYPNPSSNELYMETEALKEPLKIIMMDVTGKKIMEQTMAPGEERMRIDVSGLSSGLYIYHIATGTELKAIGRLVNNK